MRGRGEVDGARLLGLIAVALLAVGTVAAVVTVLSGGFDGERTSGRLLYSAFLLSIAILVFAAGLSLSGRRPPLPALAVGVAVLAGVAFALAARNIWSDRLFIGDWELAGSFLLIALGAGQAAVLLGWRERQGAGEAWRRAVDVTLPPSPSWSCSG